MRLAVLTVLLACASALAQPRPFCIHVQVRDAGTSVSGVALETVNNLIITTDVNGNAAFYEPGLMGKDVFFSVRHGAFAFPKDGFGYEGRALVTTEGATAVLDVLPRDGGFVFSRTDDEETRACARTVPAEGERFTLRAIDDETSRPVPLVEVDTARGLWVTDSNGVIAFYERAAMGVATAFTVFSHGYTFGDGGVTLTPRPGESAELRLHRVNVAERLYRVTGAGIAADTVLLGGTGNVLNAGVLGQDSVLSAVYRGEPFYIWGDTNRAPYPLGNFSSTGARGQPQALRYYAFDAGFVRAMAPLPGPGPVWLAGLAVVHGDGGDELWASYAKIVSLGVNAHTGLVRWNDAAEVFEPQLRWNDGGDTLLDGHPFEWQHDDGPWLEYRGGARVRPTPEAMLNPASYVLVGDAGTLWSSAIDARTGKRIDLHANDSIVWNAHRGRFVRLATRVFGDSSLLGELYYQEGDTPLGPWVFGRKVVEHRDYTFYNPRQHPFLDADGGSVIFFEGTYTTTFSGARRQTPRYDYNQVMYRLNLDDEALVLPVPVYKPLAQYATKAALPPGVAPQQAKFLAWDRPFDGGVPVASFDGPCGAGRLSTREPALYPPLFWAWPASADAGVPLWECGTGRARTYGLDASDCNAPVVLARVLPAPSLPALPVDDYSAPLKAWAGEDQCAATQNGDGGFIVTLKSAGSRARGGSIASLEWAGLFGTATGSTATVVLPRGTHEVVLTLRTADGGEAKDAVTIEAGGEVVVEPPPRACGCSGAPGVLLLGALGCALRSRRARADRRTPSPGASSSPQAPTTAARQTPRS